MANSVLISESILQDVASAIKTKKNYSSSTTLKPYNFASEISTISGGSTPTGSTTITSNGSHDVTNYATAIVTVPPSAVDSGSTTITTNGTHNVIGYASAIVNVPTSGTTPTGSINITTNGTHDVTNYASAIVNVPNSGGGSGSYTISITNADSSHQVIRPSYNNNTSYSSTVYSSDSIQVNPATISLQLVANTGYNSGTIIVDGVDSNSEAVTLTAANHTITTTNATVRDSTYIMNANITVGYGTITRNNIGGSTTVQAYSTDYGSISNGSVEYEQYGSTARKNLIEVNFQGGSSSTVSGYYQVYIIFDESLGQPTPNGGLVRIMCGSLTCSKDISNAWLGDSIYGEYSSGTPSTEAFVGDSFDDIINYSITNNVPITVRIEAVSA